MVEITDLDLDLWNYKKQKEGWSYTKISEHCGIKSPRMLISAFEGVTKRMHKDNYYKLMKWVDELEVVDDDSD